MRFRYEVVSSHPNYLVCSDGSLVRVVDGIGEGTPEQVAEMERLGLALEVYPDDAPASPEPEPAPLAPALSDDQPAAPPKRRTRKVSA